MLNSESQSLDAPDAEVIMKLTDADNAADGIFFPALEQNMMGAVLINENDEVMFSTPPQRSSGVQT